MTIYIHEFSTGIQAEATADGGWVSQGFTGQYMNKTIDPIPRAVQEAITNRDFALAEGASSNEPVFIGREVVGYGSEWSVIAVVIRGRDNKGRSASVYRYFLAEGLGNLGKILSWFNAQKQAGKNIIFDPFDTQILGQPHEYSESEPNLSLPPKLQSLLESPPPIIIPSDSPCAPLIVNKMTQEIANGQLVAWGYNVEALEEPRGFQVIQPASSRAENLLKKAIASKPNTPAPVSGEKAIISAINGLVKRDKVKPEQVATIEDALGKSQIDDSYWESIFKGRGTDKALKQGIYSADMVRLLTLRAMLLPETLPEYLSWISKPGKQQESKEISNTFQVEIKKSLRQVSGQDKKIISRVNQGVRLIIPRLIEKPQLLDSVVWLLSSTKGIWKDYSPQLQQDIDNDLKLMARYRKKQDLFFKLMNDNEWKELSNELQNALRSRFYTDSKYQLLAELFSQLGNYKLSALFYHVCSGVVPKEVFYEIKDRGFYTKIYGIEVERHIDFYEYLWITRVIIGGVKLKAIVVFFILLSGFLMGGVSSKLFLISDSEKSINQITEEFTDAYKSSGFNLNVEPKKVKNEIISLFKDNPQKINLLTDDTQKTNNLRCVVADNLSLIEESCPISQRIIAQAEERFSTSKSKLQQIEEEIQLELKNMYDAQIEEIDKKIKEDLQSYLANINNNLTHLDIINKNPIEDGDINKAIETLQQKKLNDEANKIKTLQESKNEIIGKKNNQIEDMIIEKIKKSITVIGDLNLQYCVVSSCELNENTYIQDWIKAIYSYQKKNKLKPDGILGDKTAKQLKEEVEKILVTDHSIPNH